jgi:hypothetical protein
MTKELTYDPAKVREAMRGRAEHRGVKVFAKTIPAGRRLGDYKTQSQKRKDYHAL